MFGSPQPDSPFPPRKAATAETDPIIGSSPANGDRNFETQELDAALQLLVERAQYITGATGAALALSQGEEMICRASAGTSGPAVGARLQVGSGLSGESISRKQLLRCDNAETDPRVNLETCRELGIASIVVLPLLTRNREVRGVFELFSDHAYAFEERDLIALERMADLTLTALDLAEQRHAVADLPAIVPKPGPPTPETGAPDMTTKPVQTSPVPEEVAPSEAIEELPALPPEPPLGDAQSHSALFQDAIPEQEPTAVPEAMRRIKKCTSCGFPVSEGRTLCVDCENKEHKARKPSEAVSAEFVPAFLSASPPPSESWLANHVNVLAVVVLILSIVVAIVVFR
jgi:putative methionine-R-sulfoxide reductase with GAF domain